MTAGRGFRWTLLCEDRTQERFFSKLGSRLLKCDPVHRVFAPGGRGAASAWVIDPYATYVRQTVRRYPQERVALMVVVDGDREGVRDRTNRLDDQLRPLSGGQRGEHERIAICVPTWNVETWIGWLCQWRPAGAADLDQSRSFKAEVDQRIKAGTIDIGAAITAWDTPRLEEDTHVPSLTEGRRELGRLLREGDRRP